MPSLSAILHALTAFVAAHPGGAAWIAATLVAVYRSRTPAQWVALGESNPRLQGLFKLARGGGLDPAKLLEGAAQVATGRVAVDPRDAKIAELEAALATYQRRTADAAEHDLSRSTVAPPAPIAPATFDPTAHITRAELPPVDRDPQSGRVELGALGFVLLLAMITAAAIGCPNWNRPQCGAPGRYSCDGDQPHYCAAATGELTPIGDEPCAAQGRVCALDDAGVATCVRATDGGR